MLDSQDESLTGFVQQSRVLQDLKTATRRKWTLILHMIFASESPDRRNAPDMAIPAGLYSSRTLLLMVVTFSPESSKVGSGLGLLGQKSLNSFDIPMQVI